MKIVVLGGTGLIGSRLKRRLRADWHDVVVASPSTGVDAVTGEGLAQALAGAEVVIDVSNAPSWDGPAALDFFTVAGRHALTLEAATGTWHHIALSIVGANRIRDLGYMRAKNAQEQAVRRSAVPYSIVRATQFFEAAPNVADCCSTAAGVVRLPPLPVQPIAADDVVETLAGLVAAGPLNETVEVAGPEEMLLPDFVSRTVWGLGETRPVLSDESVGYFGAHLGPTSLVPQGEASLGVTALEEWLACQGVPH